MPADLLDPFFAVLTTDQETARIGSSLFSWGRAKS
jgi:hypothetical protein